VHKLLSVVRLSQSVKLGGAKARAVNNVRVSSTSPAPLEDGSTASAAHTSSDNKSPGHARGSRSRDVDHQSPWRSVIVQPPSHAQLGQIRGVDDQSTVGIGVTSQPITDVIRREFELLRAAPSAANQLH